jgi:hypothetical protein
MLFTATVYILVRKSKGTTRWPLLAAASIMFSVSTAAVCTSNYMLFGLLINGLPLTVSVAQTKHLLLLVNT